jgi:hypothetical protein
MRGRLIVDSLHSDGALGFFICHECDSMKGSRGSVFRIVYCHSGQRRMGDG